MSDRIPTELFVTANIRKCQSQNIPVYVQRKGDINSGLIVLKILNADYQCRLYSQMRDLDGDLKWFDRNQGALMDEAAADQNIQTLCSRDPDLWVIEIETRDGENPFEGERIEL